MQNCWRITLYFCISLHTPPYLHRFFIYIHKSLPDIQDHYFREINLITLRGFPNYVFKRKKFNFKQEIVITLL